MTAPIMTTSSPPARVSAEEFLAGDWPADSWLVDGEVVMNDPGFQHQEVAARILGALRQWCDGSPGRGRAGFGGNWVMGPFSVLKPDVWWSAHIPTGTRSDTPPDLAVEVRSPGTWRYDLGRKRELYEGVGVTELWLVDPPAATLLVWRRTSGAARFDEVAAFGAGDLVTSPLFGGFNLSVDELFTATA